MPKTLTASDRSRLIHLASTLPVGSDERRVILSGLNRVAKLPYPTRRGTKVKVMKDVKLKVNRSTRLTILRGSVGKIVRVENRPGGVDSTMLDYMGPNYDPATMDKKEGLLYAIKFDDSAVKEQDWLERSYQALVKDHGYDEDRLPTTTTVTATPSYFMAGILKS